MNLNVTHLSPSVIVMTCITTEAANHGPPKVMRHMTSHHTTGFLVSHLTHLVEINPTESYSSLIVLYKRCATELSKMTIKDWWLQIELM